jgi:hypothetical protein
LPQFAQLEHLLHHLQIFLQAQAEPLAKGVVDLVVDQPQILVVMTILLSPLLATLAQV